MKYFLMILFVFSLTSCSDTHPDVYIYKSQAYTSTSVSDFEVDHFKRFGNKNFLVINDKESKKDKERQKEIDGLCHKYQLNCHKLDMSEQNSRTDSKIVEAYKLFNGEKFFVFSPSKITTARFAGTVDILENNGGEKSILYILKNLGISDSDPVKEELLALKK